MGKKSMNTILKPIPDTTVFGAVRCMRAHMHRTGCICVKSCVLSCIPSITLLWILYGLNDIVCVCVCVFSQFYLFIYFVYDGLALGQRLQVFSIFVFMSLV